MHCAKAIRAKRSKSSNVPLLPSRMLEASLIKFKEAGEGWVEAARAKGFISALEVSEGPRKLVKVAAAAYPAKSFQ